LIRRALQSDAARIAEIYNQAIADQQFATCDIKPVTVESRIDWLASHQDPFPAFVYEHEVEGVLGWSALNRFSVRSSLSTLAEVSVYVDRSHRSKLVGGRLFIHIIKEAHRLGFRSLVSLTLERNEASIRGLQAVGFRRAACLSEVARLRNEWENVVWLQKELTGDWAKELNVFMKRLSNETTVSSSNC